VHYPDRRNAAEQQGRGQETSLRRNVSEFADKNDRIECKRCAGVIESRRPAISRGYSPIVNKIDVVVTRVARKLRATVSTQVHGGVSS